MNAVKAQLARIKTDNPECTKTRQRLRSILSDFFPTEKQLINAILNAYDEDVENRLSSSSDRTLTALQLIKVLKNDYGMTDESAFLAIESWCYILGYTEVADALSFVQPKSGATESGSEKLSPEPIILACGKYTAGLDFPAGNIRLKLISLIPNNEQAQRQGVYYAVLRKGGSAIIENGFIKKQATLPLKDGQRLEIGWQGEVELTPIPEVK